MEVITQIDDATIREVSLPWWVFAAAAAVVLIVLSASVLGTFWVLRNK